MDSASCDQLSKCRTQGTWQLQPLTQALHGQILFFSRCYFKARFINIVLLCCLGSPHISLSVVHALELDRTKFSQGRGGEGRGGEGRGGEGRGGEGRGGEGRGGRGGEGRGGEGRGGEKSNAILGILICQLSFSGHDSEMVFVNS